MNAREVRIEVEGHKQLTDYVMKEAISQFEAEFHEKRPRKCRILSELVPGASWQDRQVFLESLPRAE